MTPIRLDRDSKVFLSALVAGSLFTGIMACQPQTDCSAVLATRQMLTISGNNFRTVGADVRTEMIQSAAGSAKLKGQDVFLIYDQNSTDLVGPPDVVGVSIMRVQDDGALAPAQLFTDIQVTSPGAASSVSLNATKTVGYDIAAADLDGDGTDDLVLAVSNERLGPGVVIVKDSAGGITPGAAGAPGTLTGKFMALKGAPVSITVGDLDGDGRPDLAVVLAGSPGMVQVFLNTVDGVKPLDPAKLAGAIQDPGKSSLDDVKPTQRGIIIKGNGSDPSPLVVASGDGDGGAVETFNATVLGGLVPGGAVISSALGYTILLEADTDGDGVPEIVAVDSLAGVISVVRVDNASGTQGFALSRQFSVGTDDPVTGILVADLDGDGHPDFLLGHELTHTLQQGGGTVKAELRLHSGSEIPAGSGGSVTQLKTSTQRSFAQKLGGFAKGVAKVGLRVAGSDERDYPIIIHAEPQSPKATGGIALISTGDYCGDSEHL